MKEILSSSHTGDSCIHVKHKSGLDIYIAEMNGFSSIEAIFGTKYGSVNTMFRNRDDKEYTVVPEGIAHFLEHKLFEKPFFTQESVDKELGIIGQEIQMTNDSPEWRVMFNMLGCMYHAHPVRIDIAGTQESIAQITPELLYKCYDSFYNLNNMVLSIAGNVKADEVLAICDEYLRPCEDKGLEMVFPEEPDNIVKREIREKENVGASIFSLGWKCRPASGMDRLKKNIAAAMAGEFLTDVSSEMYQKMLMEGIINSTFAYEVFSGDGFFSLIISGESEDSDSIRENVIREVKRFISEGIPEKDFRRFQKGMYAGLVRELNNVEMVATVMSGAHMDGLSPFDTIDRLAELTPQDVLDFMSSELSDDKLVLSVIERMAE